MKPKCILRAHLPGNPSRYVTVGTLFEKPDGELVIKLDSIPAGGAWNGWINAFPWEDRKPASAQNIRPEPPAPSLYLDDDIPF